MAFSRAGFPDRPFVAGTHPLEQKQTWPERGVTVLQLEPGFADPNVCRNGHLIYVLQGTLGLELDTGFEQVKQGEACALDPGTAHRALNSGQETLRILVMKP